MREKASSPEAIIFALLAALVAGGLAFGGGSGSGAAGTDGSAGAQAAAAQVRPIARRVETLRGIRFKKLPEPLIVSPEQTRRDSLRDLDRSGSPERRRRAAQVLELLGLLEPGTDLRELAGEISSEQVAGYYDTRRKRLAIVSGAVGRDPVLSEITLAHELDHALEDQRFGLRDEPATGADDAVSAYTALVEGSATSAMNDYARRFIDPGAALGAAFAALGPSASSTDSIPPYILSSLLFSYVAGERFVARLREVASGWKLVNYALVHRPPSSTEQVIHPDKYLVNERPVRVRLGELGARVPDGWRRLARGTIGEFDTDELLKLGVEDVPAGDAAAGWGGGTYELWGDRSTDCDSPCRSASALVLGWAWDTRADAGEFSEALRSYVEKELDGKAALRVRGLRVTLALAPTTERASRLAAAPPRR
jgi:hypothetical protein